MPSLNEIAVKIIVDGKELDATLKGMDKGLKNVQDSSDRAGGGIRDTFSKVKAGYLAVAGAVAGVFAGLNKAVNIASAFNEANSKFNVVFAGMEDSARKMRTELVNAYAMSTTEATKFLSSTQDLLVPMGMARDNASKMSFEVAKLAADLGSFNDQPTEQVMMDMQSALVGNFETMKKYGVVLNETVVKQEAMNMGLYDGKGLIDAAARAEAAYSLIVKGSSAAVGDMDRTSESYANTKKKIAAATEDLALKLGAVLLPIWNKVLQAILKFIDILGAENIGGVLFATWEVISEFFSRLWKIVKFTSTAWYYLITGNFSAIKEKAQDAYDAMFTGWGDFFSRVGQQYEEGGRAFDEFMAGETQTYSAAQSEMTQTNSDEEEKRDAKSRELFDKWKDRISEMVEKYKEVNVEMGEKQQELVDYLFESDRLSLDDYNYVMDERIATAKLIYGEESLEYLQLVDKKKKVDEDYYKKKTKEDELEKKRNLEKVRSFTDTLNTARTTNRSFFQLWRTSAITQATIDTYAAANAALRAYLPPFNFIAAAAVVAAGLANVASISAQKFAKGGLISQPTFGLLGEAGTELIAPKKDFVTVVNEMQARGEFGPGAGNSVLINAITDLKNTIMGQRLVTKISGDDLAIVLETGQATIAKLEY